MRYYDRECAIEVSPDIRISGLKIKFEILKSIESDKNSCRVDIYNLSEATRTRITSDNNSLIRVQAGYKENTGLVEIGQGTISNIIHNIKQPDVISTIYAKDGFSSVRNNLVSLSFDENTRLDTIIQNITELLGLPVGFTDYDGSALLKGGFSYLGPLTDAIEQLSTQFVFNWSIQNGRFQVVNKNVGGSNSAVVLSASTGLIQDPEEIIETKDLALETKNQYKVVSLLQPQMQVGDKVRIDSRTLDGFYIVQELTHIGDTRGNDWSTTMRVIENG